MKHVLKGLATTAIILLVSIAISAFCNIKGINVDIVFSGPALAVCAVFIYNGLIKNEKNNDNKDN